MNKNTTDITLSSYFNDIVIGYYEDEDLVKTFGKKFGFNVDKDIFTAISFLYPSDAYVTVEDKEALRPAAEAMIQFSEINKQIQGSQVMMADMGLVVILTSHSKNDMHYAMEGVMNEAIAQVEKIDSSKKIRVGIGTFETGIKGIKHTYRNAQNAVRAGEIFKPDRIILDYLGMEVYSAINQMVVSYGDRLTRTVLNQLGETEKKVLAKYYKCKEDVAITAQELDMTEDEVKASLAQVKINTGLDVQDNEDNFKLHFIFIAKKVLENDEKIKRSR